MSDSFQVSHFAGIASQLLEPIQEEIRSNPVVRAFLQSPEEDQLKVMGGLGALFGASQAALRGEKLSRGALTGLILGTGLGLLIPKLL